MASDISAIADFSVIIKGHIALSLAELANTVQYALIGSS